MDQAQDICRRGISVQRRIINWSCAEFECNSEALCLSFQGGRSCERFANSRPAWKRLLTSSGSEVNLLMLMQEQLS